MIVPSRRSRYPLGYREDLIALPVHELPIFRPVKQFRGQQSDHQSVDHTQDNHVHPHLPKPVSHRQSDASGLTFPSHASILDQIKSDEKERIAQPIVGPGFRDDDPLQILGYMLVGEGAFDNRIGKDGIGRGDAGPNGERVQE